MTKLCFHNIIKNCEYSAKFKRSIFIQVNYYDWIFRWRRNIRANILPSTSHMLLLYTLVGKQFPFKINICLKEVFLLLISVWFCFRSNLLFVSIVHDLNFRRHLWLGRKNSNKRTNKVSHVFFTQEDSFN